VSLFSNTITLGWQVKGIPGIRPEDNVGKVIFPTMQAAPSFASSFPHLVRGNDPLQCLIPCAIDRVQYLWSNLDSTTLVAYLLASILIIYLAAQNSTLVRFKFLYIYFQH
jgi:tryptophanyl-tRNA synthetase